MIKNRLKYKFYIEIVLKISYFASRSLSHAIYSGTYRKCYFIYYYEINSTLFSLNPSSYEKSLLIGKFPISSTQSIGSHFVRADALSIDAVNYWNCVFKIAKSIKSKFETITCFFSSYLRLIVIHDVIKPLPF